MSMTLDTSEFHAAVREHLASTKRDLATSTNARMFYLLVRVFALLAPRDIQSARNKVRDYMTTPVSARGYITKSGQFKRHAKIRQVQRRHLIAQSRRAKEGKVGAYGQEMKAAAASVMRRAVGSVGYLKSPIVRALKIINGHFTQFGFRTKKAGGKEISPNSALVKIAAQYGTGMSNVGMHKGAKASARRAMPGVSPTSIVRLSLGIADGQDGAVSRQYHAAFSRAMSDEVVEIRRHLAAKMQDLADDHKPK